MNNKNKIQTPEETARAVERMADRLEEMDKADGVLGEALEDEDLDEVAGGARTVAPEMTTCPVCGQWFAVGFGCGNFCSQNCKDRNSAAQSSGRRSQSGKQHHAPAHTW